MLKGKRFDKVKEALESRPDVEKVELDEEFIPPHKQAGFLPYDVILRLEEPVYGGEDEWSEETVTSMLYGTGLDFDEVVNVEDDSKSGLQLAFVSLVTEEEAFGN